MYVCIYISYYILCFRPLTIFVDTFPRPNVTSNVELRKRYAFKSSKRLFSTFRLLL